MQNVSEVKIKRIHPEATIPLRGSEAAVGYDVTTVEDACVLYPGESKLFATGIALELPAEIECQVRPRSGFSIRNSVIIPNSPGTIDPDYRGEVKVCLMNIGKLPVLIEKGQRIAQLVFNPVLIPEIKTVEELSSTERGEGGFGSTGR